MIKLTFFVEFFSDLYLEVLFNPSVFFIFQGEGTEVGLRSDGCFLDIEAETTLQLDGGHSTIMFKANSIR
jgi:hypothetical protein